MFFLHYLWLLLWWGPPSSEKIGKALTQKRLVLGATDEEYKKLEKRIGWLNLNAAISILLSIAFFILVIFATMDISALDWGNIALLLFAGFFEFFFFKWNKAEIARLLEIK